MRLLKLWVRCCFCFVRTWGENVGPVFSKRQMFLKSVHVFTHQVLWLPRGLASCCERYVCVLCSSFFSLQYSAVDRLSLHMILLGHCLLSTYTAAASPASLHTHCRNPFCRTPSVLLLFFFSINTLFNLYEERVFELPTFLETPAKTPRNSWHLQFFRKLKKYLFLMWMWVLLLRWPNVSSIGQAPLLIQKFDLIRLFHRFIHL